MRNQHSIISGSYNVARMEKSDTRKCNENSRDNEQNKDNKAK